MSFFSGLFHRFRGAFDPNRLAMSQAFLAGDYGSAAEQFRQLQAEHERLRMWDRKKRSLGGAESAGGYDPVDPEASMPKPGFDSATSAMGNNPMASGGPGAEAGDPSHPSPSGRYPSAHEGLHGDGLHLGLSGFHSAGSPAGGQPAPHRLDFEQPYPADGSTFRPEAVGGSGVLFSRERSRHAPSHVLAASFQQHPDRVGLGAEARTGPARAGIAIEPQPSAGTPPPLEDRAHRLGRLSARYESPGGGPDTVSTGNGDPGGRSYGTWQLNQRMVGAFVSSNDAQRWTREFQGLQPATPQFDATWRRIAAREPAAFEDAQYAFIRRENYENLASRVRRSTGLDVDRFGDTMRNVVWSTATQQGSVERLRSFETAIRVADQRMRRDDPRYGELLIRQVYAARIDQALRQSRVHAGRGQHGQARTMRNVATRRLPDELADALRMYGSERASGGPGTMGSAP